MRPRHTQHSLPSFPVYSTAFISSNLILLGGGGGASRSGIKNKLRLYELDEERNFTLKDEFELEKGEDAPMSMAAQPETGTLVCGINSVEEKLSQGENEHCRSFRVDDKKIQSILSKGFLPINDIEDYQKVTALSPDGAFLIIAGAHDLCLLKYPSLEPAAELIHTEKEIYDATFSETTLVVATTHNLFVYSLPHAEKSSPSSQGKGKTKKKGKETKSVAIGLSQLKLLNTVELPVSTGLGSKFRAVRYHPLDNKIVYAVVNASPPRSRQTRSIKRQAFICRYNTDSWVLEKSRKIGDNLVTAFDISVDGRFLGYGSSDLMIGVLDAKTLAPLVTILKAHELAVTTIKFNPTTTLLVSCSADCSVRVVNIPQVMNNSPTGFIILLLLTILVVILGLVVQRYLATNTLPWRG